MMPKKELAGRTFGKWTALHEITERSSQGDVMWLCRCACGTEKTVCAKHLASGASTRCRRCASRIAAASRHRKREDEHDQHA